MIHRPLHEKAAPNDSFAGRGDGISPFQISVSLHASHRNACIAGMISVRGSEWVNRIFCPHFLHTGSTYFFREAKTFGNKRSGSVARAAYVSPRRIIEIARSPVIVAAIS